MGSVTPSLTFDVLGDTKPNDPTLPAFMVSTTRGFLPRAEPIVELPAEFDILESILTRSMYPKMVLPCSIINVSLTILP